MKVFYQANEWGPRFDDPISCQIFERVLKFLEDQEGDTEWQPLQDASMEGFSDSEYSLQCIVEERNLFRRLMDKIAQVEAEL